MVDSDPCPEGFRRRSSYTSKSGHRVNASCIKSRSVYRESSKNYTRRMLQRQSRRLKDMKKLGTRKVSCPPGMVERKGYVRKFGTDILEKGYTVHKSTGKDYRIFPEKQAVYVKPGCIKKHGATERIAPGDKFGILRKGELKKHGYVYTKSMSDRHEALKKAINEFKPIGVFHKLDAIAKLSKYTVPQASKVFKTDREWVASQYKLKNK